MKHVFIVNPTAGKGNGVEYIPFIDAYFKENPGDYVIEVTEREKHATQIAAKYTAEDDVTIYSVGGDGTSKEVLDGLNPGVTLCVVPGGTGNDFYKSVDKRKLTKPEILKGLIEGEEIKIDYALMNGTEKFMNITSFGLDADINVYACDYVKKELNIPGNLVYAYSAFKVGLHPKVIQMEMTIDGVTLKKGILLAALCNGGYYGGMFHPVTEYSLSDGYIDICVVKGPMKLLRLIYLITKYANGKHIGAPEIEIYRARNISLKFDREVYMQIDGENVPVTEAEFEVIPQGLTIKVPKNRRV